MALKRIVSGAQTGADRAALDAALELGVPCGGWVPKGRIDEYGRIPDRYPNLVETETSDFSARTAANVRDTAGTLIISRGALTGGSLYTQEVAAGLGKPCLHLDLETTPHQDACRILDNWLVAEGIDVLNVAGPRESKDPELYPLVVAVLRAALR
jgi:hypothetical protein